MGPCPIFIERLGSINVNVNVRRRLKSDLVFIYILKIRKISHIFTMYICVFDVMLIYIYRDIDWLEPRRSWRLQA